MKYETNPGNNWWSCWLTCVLIQLTASTYMFVDIEHLQQVSQYSYPYITKKNDSDFDYRNRGKVLIKMSKYFQLLCQCEELSLNDNRWLWQSGAWREKIRTPQLGNEPGTSRLSFGCSTNWATREFMSSPSKPSHYPVTLSVCTICLYRLVTYCLW